MQPVPFQPGAAVEGDQLDEKRERVHFPAKAGDQVGRRARGAAGREQVVDDQDALPLLDGSSWISSESVPYSSA